MPNEHYRMMRADAKERTRRRRSLVLTPFESRGGVVDIEALSDTDNDDSNDATTPISIEALSSSSSDDDDENVGSSWSLERVTAAVDSPRAVAQCAMSLRTACHACSKPLYASSMRRVYAATTSCACRSRALLCNACYDERTMAASTRAMASTTHTHRHPIECPRCGKTLTTWTRMRTSLVVHESPPPPPVHTSHEIATL